MLRRSILLGEQHADPRHGAQLGAHRLRASCAKVTPAARRHRDLRRERRVASVRTLALIRAASLVTRAPSKHSLGAAVLGAPKGPCKTPRRENTSAGVSPRKSRCSFTSCACTQPLSPPRHATLAPGAPRKRPQPVACLLPANAAGAAPTFPPTQRLTARMCVRSSSSRRRTHGENKT